MDIGTPEQEDWMYKQENRWMSEAADTSEVEDDDSVIEEEETDEVEEGF